MSALANSNSAVLNPFIRSTIAAIFWSWFDSHANDVVLQKKLLWFAVVIRVRDLEGVFRQLVGERGVT